MKIPVAVAACALALVGGGLTAAEISGAFGNGTVDEQVVQEQVHKVVIHAEDGDVTLVRAVDDIHVRVKRSHVINTPSTSQRVADGVLTLKTRCPIGLVGCRSDYRVGVPAGVAVTIDKPSGRVDARAIGGEITEFRDESVPLTVTRQVAHGQRDRGAFARLDAEGWSDQP